MGYSAAANVFYGILLPENTEIEDSDIEGYNLIPVFYGNALVGPFYKAVAIKNHSVFDEYEAKEINLDFSDEEIDLLEKLKEFMKQNDLLNQKIGWYLSSNYG